MKFSYVAGLCIAWFSGAAWAQPADSSHSSISTKSFCGNIYQGLEGVLPPKAIKSGIDQFMAQVYSGEVLEYVDVGALSGEPSPDKKWLSTADILTHGLGSLDHSAILIRDPNELRYASHVVKSINIVLLTSEVFSLTPEQMGLVTDAIIVNGGHLFVVYTGKTNSIDHLKTMRSLADMSWATGGQIVVWKAGVTCSRLRK